MKERTKWAVRNARVMKPRYVLQYVAVPKAYLQMGAAALRHHAQGLLCEKRRNRDHPVNSSTLRLRYPLPNRRLIPRKLQKGFLPFTVMLGN